MKKKFVISAIILAIIFVLAYRLSKKPAIPEQVSQENNPINVTVQPAQDSHEMKIALEYPAEIVGDQEISITAKTSGNVLASPLSLGSWVSSGSILARIDDTGSFLKTDNDSYDFRSSQIQQAQLSVEQAEKQLDLGKKNYKNLKNDYDDNENGVTKTQVDNAKKQIDIYEIQLENAKVGYRGTLDNHVVTSPISGYITEKSVSIGDSVSVGQKIATISQTGLIKIRFFISQDQLPFFSKGLKITISAKDGETRTAIVRNISPIADPATKRFLIEAYPEKQDKSFFISGTLASVSLDVIQKSSEANDFLLPLSAITIGQNESYLFTVENNHAKKISVTIVNVQGESAQIKAAIPSDGKIILDGNKLVRDGDLVAVKS